MKFKPLFDEFNENLPGDKKQLIGPKIYALVGELVRQKARRYPIQFFNNGSPWDEDALLSLHHEVIVEQLLQRKQINFVFGEPDPITDEHGYEGVCKRLNFVIGRVLTDRLRRAKALEVRLAGRVRRLARRGFVEEVTFKRARYYRLPESGSDYQDLTNRQIVECANSVRHLPRVVERPESQKQSMGYRTEDLRALVQTVLEAVGSVSEADFMKIFEILFTPFGPTTLVRAEEALAMPSVEKDDADLAEMKALVAVYVAELEAKQLIVVVGKSQGLSDAEVGVALGNARGNNKPVARPTVQGLREAINAGLRTKVLDEISPDLLDDALDEFAWQCTERLGGSSQ